MTKKEYKVWVIGYMLLLAALILMAMAYLELDRQIDGHIDVVKSLQEECIILTQDNIDLSKERDRYKSAYNRLSQEKREYDRLANIIENFETETGMETLNKLDQILQVLEE